MQAAIRGGAMVTRQSCGQRYFFVLKIALPPLKVVKKLLRPPFKVDEKVLRPPSRLMKKCFAPPLCSHRQ